MKGTIDQVEAIFAGMSSAWSRAITLIAALWSGHFAGLLAERLDWIEGHLRTNLEWTEVAAIPLTWMLGVATSFVWPLLGLCFVLVAGACCYLLIFSEAPRTPLIVVLFVSQSWLTFLVERFIVQSRWKSLSSAFGNDSIIGPFFLAVNTFGGAYVAINLWRRAQR